MDYKKLSSVGTTKIATPRTRAQIMDAIKRAREQRETRIADSAKEKELKKKKILDAIKRARASRSRRVSDSKKFKFFRVTDGYKNLLKKVKDDLAETESTEEAVECALCEITEDTPAEQVLAAVVEALGETIDQIQEDAEDPDDLDDVDPDDIDPDDVEPDDIADSRRRRKVRDAEQTYEEMAYSNNGVSLLNKAKKDKAFKPGKSIGKLSSITNGKEMFVFGDFDDFFDASDEEKYDNLEKEGWKFLEQSNQKGNIMWNLYKKIK